MMQYSQHASLKVFHSAFLDGREATLKVIFPARLHGVFTAGDEEATVLGI